MNRTTSSPVKIMRTASHAPVQLSKEKLIITTGDLSDADGFMALATYAKTGADALYILNYPAFFCQGDNANFDKEEKGLGFMFSVDTFLQTIEKKYTSVNPEESPFAKVKYDDAKKAFDRTMEVLDQYSECRTNQDKIKGAFTDFAFCLCKKVWEAGSTGGKLYFAIGETNVIQPFGVSIVKNEIAVYYDCVVPKGDMFNLHHLVTDTNTIFNMEGNVVKDLHLNNFNQIACDFNGSAAFWNDFWQGEFAAIEPASKFLGLYVMGGVYSDQPAKTACAIPGILNRFSAATMNQLYEPNASMSFLQFVGVERNWKIFTVSNNVVELLKTTRDTDDYAEGMYPNRNNTKWTEIFTDEVEELLEAHGIRTEPLVEICKCYYTANFFPQAKPFDLYTALGLAKGIEFDGEMGFYREENLEDGTITTKAPKWFPENVTKKFLHVNGDNGISFISTSMDYLQAFEEYYSQKDPSKQAQFDAERQTIEKALEYEVKVPDSDGKQKVIIEKRELSVVTVEVWDMEPTMDMADHFKIKGI